jgi:hypothetical protein
MGMFMVNLTAMGGVLVDIFRRLASEQPYGLYVGRQNLGDAAELFGFQIGIDEWLAIFRTKNSSTFIPFPKLLGDDRIDYTKPSLWFCIGLYHGG